MNLWLSPMLAQVAAKATETVVEASTETAPTSSSGPWLLLLVMAAVLILPFMVGNWLATALKVRDMAGRFGMVLLALTIAIAPFAAHLISAPADQKSLIHAFSYGIDLAGGFNLVYQIDKEAAKAGNKSLDAATMRENVGAVTKRVNPAGTEEVSVRQVGSDRIEVIVPGADAAKMLRIKNQITNLGQLEFSLLANRREFSSIISLAESKGPTANEIIQNGVLVAKWRPLAKDSTGKYKEVSTGGDVITREVTRGGESQLEFLVICAKPGDEVTGEELVRATEQTDQNGGLAVGFQFNSTGSRRFSKLTGAHLPQPGNESVKTQLAILLNDKIHSAPTINDRISGSGQISGQFTRPEIEELIAVLNAGALKLPLIKEPVNEFAISPLLGVEIRNTGLLAAVFSMVAVFLITAIYYRKAGLIADLCLALNLFLLLSSLALIDATLTLPGIAGIVLSVAMAVDANVLIFERIREELAKGSSMRMAIKNGFDKALGTIIDSNLTTLISAVVLYYVGTDQVKGFAVTLFLGIVISLFTAVTVARLIFELLERLGKLKSLTMYNIVKQTNVDFVGKTRAFITASIVVIGLGLVATAVRGRDNLDIDFRGGAMVTLRFDGTQKTDIETVRAPLVKAFNDGISIERLLVNDEQGQEIELFRMRTVTDREEAQSSVSGESVEEQLRSTMRDAFSGTPLKLLQQTLQISESTVIATVATENLSESQVLREKKFEGGRQFTVTLGQSLTPAALSESVKSGLLAVGSGQKYTDSDELVDVRHTDPSIAATVKGTSHLVRIANGVEPADAEKVAERLVSKLNGQPLFEELTTFSASVAGDTQIRAVLAILISMVAITAYLWFRFSGMTFGIAASIALFHDIAFTLGMVTVGAWLSRNAVGQGLYLIDFKINLTMIAAFLTIIGYSLNDTIVVFDRIREVRGKNPKITWEMVNISLNQTLSRTLLTSATTIITSIILYFFGGEGLRGFAYCLTIGILIGTYSSLYIASPALVWIMSRKQPEAPKAALPASPVPAKV